MNALKVIESEIDKCINTARTSFLRVAELITKVRDEEIYLEAFKTFEEWCEVGMGWTKRRANQLIAGAEVVNDLPPSLAKEVKTESEARALGTLDREDQKRAIREAKQENIPITKAVKLFQEKPAGIGPKPGTNVPITKVVIDDKKAEPEPVFDATGLIVREAMVPLWNRGDEVRSLMAAVSKIKCALERAGEEDDPLYRPVTFKDADGKGETWSNLMAGMSNVYTALKLAIPYSICPACSTRKKDCTTCWGRGFVSEHFWKVQTSKETRAIRANVVKQQGVAK